MVNFKPTTLKIAITIIGLLMFFLLYAYSQTCIPNRLTSTCEDDSEKFTIGVIFTTIIIYTTYSLIQKKKTNTV